MTKLDGEWYKITIDRKNSLSASLDIDAQILNLQIHLKRGKRFEIYCYSQLKTQDKIYVIPKEAFTYDLNFLKNYSKELFLPVSKESLSADSWDGIHVLAS